MVALPAADIRRAVRLGIAEDLSQGDITTSALFSTRIQARARIVAQEDLIVAGMTPAVQTFLAVDPSLKLSVVKRDGTAARSGEVLITITGDGRSILMAERVALNFLQHLSGIATLTRRFCRAVQGYPARIMDTRKTLPGWRAIQKWAVALGGGINHRKSLGDGLLVKDNHLALLGVKREPVLRACLAVKSGSRDARPLIVEVESLRDVKEALRGNAEIILLDNMTVTDVRKAVRLIDGRALVEISGGITLKNVRAMAATGADRISIGALTHSAPAATLTLELKAVSRPKRRS